MAHLRIRLLLTRRCHREIEDAWKQAVSSFSSLKDEGKLSAELWDILQAQSDPSGLLQILKKSPYAQRPNTGRLLQLAEGCVDAVMHFDSEIGMVMQGAANWTLGASCIVWGGLGLVFHVRGSICSLQGSLTDLDFPFLSH